MRRTTPSLPCASTVLSLLSCPAYQQSFPYFPALRSACISTVLALPIHQQVLESAQSSILLILWYVFKDDPKIAEVATILKAKLKQGVKVREGVCARQLQVVETRVGAG